MSQGSIFFDCELCEGQALCGLLTAVESSPPSMVSGAQQVLGKRLLGPRRTEWMALWKVLSGLPVQSQSNKRLMTSGIKPQAGRRAPGRKAALRPLCRPHVSVPASDFRSWPSVLFSLNPFWRVCPWGTEDPFGTYQFGRQNLILKRNKLLFPKAPDC